MIKKFFKQKFKYPTQVKFNFSHFRLILCLITLIQTNAASAQFKQNMCQKIFLDSNKPSLEQVINSLVLSNLSIHDTSELSLKQSLMSKLNDELKLLKSIYDEDAVLKYYHELSEIHKSLSKGLNKEKSNNDIDSKFIPYIYPMDLNSIDSYFFATKMNQRFFVAIDQKSASLQVIDTEKINKPIQIIPIPAMINNANMHPKPNDTHIAFLQRNQLILKSKDSISFEHFQDIFDFRTQSFQHIVTTDLETKLYHYNPKYNVSVLQENERVNGMIREFLRLSYSNGKIVTITGSAINQLKLVNDDFALFIKDNSTLECLIWKTGELIKLFSNSVRLLFINDHFAFFLNRNDANKYEVIKVAMKNGQIIQSVIGIFDHFITKSDSENNDRILVQVANEQKGLYRIIDYNQAKITEEFKIDNAPKDFMYNKDRLFLGDYSYIVTHDEKSLTFIPIGNKKVSSEAITLPRDLETKSNIFNTKTLQLIEIFYDRVQLTHLISKEVLTISLPYKFRVITQYLLSENQKILIIAGHTTNNENKSVLIHLSM